MRAPSLETVTARVTATALLSEFLLQPGVVMAATPARIVAPEAVCEYATPVEFDPSEIGNLRVTEPQELKLHEPESKWSKAMDRRFEELSIREALGNLSGAELDELENLTKERRRLHHPRTADEILFEYRQRKVTSDLVKAVQEYVDFHDLPHKAGSTTR